jgi:hypothetical protein
MKEVVDPPYVAETLKWCNEIRKDRGMGPLDKLPRGIRYDNSSCPCGRATGVCVEEWGWYDPKGFKPHEHVNSSKATKVPIDVVTFVVSFDRGYLPQYDETKN